MIFSHHHNFTTGKEGSNKNSFTFFTYFAGMTEMICTIGIKLSYMFSEMKILQIKNEKLREEFSE